MNTSAIIHCVKLSKKFHVGEEEISILDGIDLDIFPGESIAITGRSGSGKTTLIRLLSGLDVPSAGEIYLFEHLLNPLNEDERAVLRSRYIGIVFQSFHLLAGFSALENVMLPLEIAEDPGAFEIAVSLLEQVGMADRLRHMPATLSGGEQQRVAIARAFATAPPLLLADEPTGNLDVKSSRKIIDLLFRLNYERGTSLVLVTHEEVLSRRADRCLHLSQDGLTEI